MPREVNEKNLKEAFCKAIAKTGVGAAENDCDKVISELVNVTVPEFMHRDYPVKLKAAVVFICTSEPYGWTVNDETPTIDDDTTFGSLYEDWLKKIIFP